MTRWTARFLISASVAWESLRPSRAAMPHCNVKCLLTYARIRKSGRVHLEAGQLAASALTPPVVSVASAGSRPESPAAPTTCAETWIGDLLDQRRPGHRAENVGACFGGDDWARYDHRDRGARNSEWLLSFQVPYTVPQEVTARNVVEKPI